MASIWGSAFSSIWSICSELIWLAPGIMASSADAPPILRIWANWVNISFISNLLAIIRLAASSASLSFCKVWAFSIRLSTSPMPRIRLDMRAG